MANEMLTVSQSTSYSLDQDDNLYIAAGLSIMVLNGNGIKTTIATSNNTAAHIDGTVVAVGSFTALFLTGIDAGVGSHFVSIGATGLVRSTGSAGIIASGTGNQVINAGQIVAFSTGVSLGSGLGLVQNRGSISSGGTGISSSGATNTISNDGSLVATGIGISFTNASGLHQIENTGLIHSLTGTAISLAGNTNNVSNDGTVLADGSAISLSGGSGNFVSNEGRIRGGLNGIVLSGGGTGNVVQNFGKITAHDDGIVSDSVAGFTTNSGTITAGRDGIILTGAGTLRVQNTGQITALQDGIDASASIAQIRSTGTISAKENGISAGGTGSVLVNGSTIDAGGIGLAIFKGGRAVNLGTIDAEIGLRVAGSESTARNAGTIDAGDTGILGIGEGLRIFNSGHILADTGILAEDAAARILNSGSIQAATGIKAGPSAVITNQGEIGATGVGIEVDGDASRLINEGSIVSSIVGVFVQGGSGSFSLIQEEAGTIAGRSNGIASNGLELDIVNHGAIYGGGGSGAAVGGDSLAVVFNYGLISGSLAASTDPVPGLGKAISLAGATNDRIVNFGTMIGAVELGAGNDSLVSFGLIHGDIRLGAGADVLDNRSGRHVGTALGEAGADTMAGGVSNETLDGGADADRMNGGDGNDTMVGGTGADIMSGGAGLDVFLFRSSAEIGIGASADKISDFVAGTDDISLSQFMAGGSFIGAAAFGGVARQVRYIAATGTVQGDVDGNGVADWELVLTSKPTVTAADFIF